VQAVTSYGDTSATEVVNQVVYGYYDWGKLAEEWQEHDGEVDTQTTAGVQYVYDDGAAGGVAKYVRLAEVVYPNDRSVGYDYGTAGATDDIMSRLSSIFDDADSDGDLDTGEDVYAAYKYLGAGKIVTEDYVDSKVRLNYLAGEFGEFRGLCQEAWERGTTNMK